MRSLAILTSLLVLAPALLAQLPAPNAAGVSAGHMHLMVRDPEVHKKIWVDALGAQVVNSGALELLKLPGIFLVLGKAEPAEGFGRIQRRSLRVSSEGSPSDQGKTRGRWRSDRARRSQGDCGDVSGQGEGGVLRRADPGRAGRALSRSLLHQ